MTGPRFPSARHRALSRSQDDLALTLAICELANSAANVNEVITHALSTICEHKGWQVGHAFAVYDVSPVRVRSTKLWYFDDPERWLPLKEQSEDERFFPLLTQVVRDQSALVLEPEEGLVTERHSVAESLGLGYHYVVPILAGDVAVAALEFFSTDGSGHDSETLAELLGALGAILGQVAEREARFRQARELALADGGRREAERRAAELLRISTKLRRRNRELDQFAYAASHDLRAPLRGISNLVGWLEKDLEPHLDDQTRRYLGLLQGRVARMESLINGLLQYSRVGRKALPDERIDTRALVEELADTLGVGHPVQFELGELPVVEGPRLLLRQALDNFISNALKYAVPVDPRVEIWAEREDEQWVFHVRDHGPGIAARHQERIWEIFQTLQPRDEIESTGIGLSLVRKIVQRRGGEVRVDSREGEGATFSFTWPDTSPQSQPESEA